MPQLVQALKYELFHNSPLAEFLLEKALSNTRVVGHAFFWALKSNLDKPVYANDLIKPKDSAKEKKRIEKSLGPFMWSVERFFLICERFLMCCGQFKNELFKQDMVNKSFFHLSTEVNALYRDKVKAYSKEMCEDKMHEIIKQEEIKIKLMQQLIIAHARFDDCRLASEDELHNDLIPKRSARGIANTAQNEHAQKGN